MGVLKRAIPKTDWLKLLTMNDKPDCIVNIGSWVQVRKGAYKGDAALVVAINHWGVDVLLLPRLKPPIPDWDVPQKRKRSTIPATPSLFDATGYQQTYGIQPTWLVENVYKVGQVLFEHGLLRKGYDLHSLSSTAVDMPSQFFTMYESSRHPALGSSKFPRPREWIFEIGEQVFNCKTEAKGVVLDIGNDYVEINFGVDNGGIRPVTWHDIRKDINIGDFVQVTSGADTGVTGWVDNVHQDDISIVDKTTKGDIITQDTIKVLLFAEFHLQG